MSLLRCLGPLVFRNVNHSKRCLSSIATVNSVFSSKVMSHSQVYPHCKINVRHLNAESFLNKLITRRKVSENEQRKKDSLSPDFKLVHQATSVKYLKVFQLSLPICTVFIVGSLVPKLYTSGLEFITSNFFDILSVSGIYLALCAAFISVANVYPYRIYYNTVEDYFTVIKFGFTWNLTKKVKLVPGTGVPAQENFITENFAPWLQDAFEFEGGHKLVISRNNFVSPLFYNKLLKISY